MPVRDRARSRRLAQALGWLVARGCGGLVAIAACLLAPALSRAQAGTGARSDSTATGAGLRIHGTLVDSLAHSSLRGALVQLSGAGTTNAGRRYTATAEGDGTFRLSGVVPGEYSATFYHPALDTLGVDVGPIRVAIDSMHTTVALAMPSARTLMLDACPASADRGSAGTLLIGEVRDARSAEPLPHAGVVVTWRDLNAVASSLQMSERGRSVETADNGWFATCAAPADEALFVRAGLGADSTGLVRITIPREELRHLSLYIASNPSRSSSTTDVVFAPAQDAGTPLLLGRVVDDAGSPVRGASVDIWGSRDGASTAPDGTFRIPNPPGGTQTIELRAVGWMSVDTVVQLLRNDTTNVRVTLARAPVALPGIAVTAAEAASLKIGVRGFSQRLEDHRRGLGFGTFITPADIEQRRASFLTQMLYQISGIKVMHGMSPTDDRLLGADGCPMTVYLDGVRVIGSLGREAQQTINELAPVTHVAGIEVYPRPVDAPGAYQTLNGGCGIVLVWTK